MLRCYFFLTLVVPLVVTLKSWRNRRACPLTDTLDWQTVYFTERPLRKITIQCPAAGASTLPDLRHVMSTDVCRDRSSGHRALAGDYAQRAVGQSDGLTGKLSNQARSSGQAYRKKNYRPIVIVT